MLAFVLREAAYRGSHRMRQLEDVVVKAMAMVKAPANKKRFLTMKSQEPQMPESPESSFQSAPSAVVDAVRAVALAKGEDAAASDSLEAVAHLIHGNSGLTLQDLMAVGQAAGLEDVAKADKKAWPPKKKVVADAEDGEEDVSDDEEDAEAEEDSEAEDGDDEEEMPKGKMGKKMPPFLKKKLAKHAATPAADSAAPVAGEGGPMPADKAEVSISKSEYDLMRTELAKAHERNAAYEHEKALAVEKSANQGKYGALTLDHDALARTTLSLKKSASKEDVEAFEASLAAANEQVKVSKSAGASIYTRKSSPQNSSATAPGMNFKALVDAEITKSEGKLTREQAIQAVAKSEAARSAYASSEGAN